MNKYEVTKGEVNRKEKQPVRKPVQVRNSVKLSDAINKAWKKTNKANSTVQLPYQLVASCEELSGVHQRETPSQVDSRTALLALLEAHLDDLASTVMEASLLSAAGELPVAHLKQLSQQIISMKMM
jgi:hypothetical protein